MYEPRSEPGEIPNLAAATKPTEKPITPDSMLERLRDPHYLPSHADIELAFAQRPTDGRFGAEARFAEFCSSERPPVYELLNQEFINALGNYLAQRAAVLGGTQENPITVLELGAGTGRLSGFLRQMLEENNVHNLNITATDIGTARFETAFDVEPLDYRDALYIYQPQIVLSSWMPQGVDFTAAIRDQPSVQEYILSGQQDVCGDPWTTWGHPTGSPKSSGLAPKPPFEQDGFLAAPLVDISSTQLCRNDNLGKTNNSETYTFRRVR